MKPDSASLLLAGALPAALPMRFKVLTVLL
ncbi:hypothetical protein CBA19C6_11275 [Cupriavidus pauculus]|nr:hypothetical protein CBA19C6_11275 [Cupriavidus pauculus]